MKRKIFSILFALVLVFSFSVVAPVPVAAQDPTPTVTFVPGGATGTAAWSAEQQHSGLRSAKMTTTDPNDRGMVRFEFGPGELTLDDLTTLSYWEYVSARDNPLDVFIDIWLDFDNDGDADVDDYPGYMQAEPLYTVGAAPLNTWTPIDAMNLKWSTYVGPDDPYDAPTIYDFQANASGPCVHGYTMADWNGGVDFGPLSILRIDVRVGYGGTWANFTGYADDICINSYTQGFEPLAEVWVDDDFSPATTGWGYDSFATTQDGIGAVAENGTVNVLAGTYLKKIVINKALMVKSTDGAEDTIIQGISTSDYYLVDIQHSDVTFEGFTVTNPTTAFGSDVSGILVQYVSGDPVSNVHILNNIVTQVRSENGTPSMFGATGINVGNAPLSNIFISGNIITDIKNPDGAPVDHTCGINVWDGAVNVVILNNTISDIKYNGIILEHASNVLIEDNSITKCPTGIRVEPYEGVTVSGLTVNFNNFTNNSPIQVFDGAGALVIEDVLANNLFDRAVTVDRGGFSLLHTIWSKIQGAIDAAQTGDTVIVAKGRYTEVVAVNKSVDLLGANAGVNPGTRGDESAESVVNAFDISVNGVVVDGFLINGADLGTSVDNMPPTAIYLRASTSGHTIANNILPGPGGTPPSTGRGILFGYTISNTTVTCNEIYGWKSGIYINPTGLGSNLLFQYNSIHHNWAGIGSDGLNDVSILNNNFSHNVEGFGSSNVGVNVGAHFNNFCGNTTAIAQYGGEPIDATNNWWCDASGPHASPGYGDPVSGDVLYNPWLLYPLVPGAPLPTIFDKTLALNIGWTLVSTDNWIDAANTVGEGVVLALNYTPSLGWFEVTPAALVPVDAIYLKMEEGGGLGINYSGGVPVASSKDLEAGWNLISSATLTNARAVLSPLRYVQVGNEQGIGLTTLVSQGNCNQHSPSFYLATLGLGDWNFLGQTTLNPFDGYWVCMNAGKSFGVVPGH